MQVTFINAVMEIKCYYVLPGVCGRRFCIFTELLYLQKKLFLYIQFVKKNDEENIFLVWAKQSFHF